MYIPIIKILLSIIMFSLATGIALFFVKELTQHTDRIRKYKDLGDKLLQPMRNELRGERLSRAMLFAWFILIETTVLFFEYVAIINLK